MKLPEKKFIASFDIDAQNTFTPICPNELPVVEGDLIADELNAQAKFASLRVASRDAHTPKALWLSDENNPPLSPIEGHPDLDIRWPAHAIIGTKGFDFIPGLDPAAYDFQVFKGIGNHTAIIDCSYCFRTYGFPWKSSGKHHRELI